MAIVSDGHGGSRYFRSDKGSKLVVEITKDSIDAFLKSKNISELFLGSDFTQIGVGEGNSNDKRYQALKWLISSIISKWNKEIWSDAINNPLTAWEKDNVDPKFLVEFEANVNGEDSTLEKIYGCTLMAYVQTDNFWFAFQIGDGKMVFFNQGNDGFESSQLVPWDDKCFLNKTTSICDSDAANEFRFCYAGNGELPFAVFLGSDGIDDTYGDGEKLTDFYVRLYKEIASTSNKKAFEMLKTDLPIISKMGSQDDMSIACIYNKNRNVLNQNFLLMIVWQISCIHARTNNLEDKIAELKAKRNMLESIENPSESEKIDLHYANLDLEKAYVEKEKLEDEIVKLQTQDREFRKKKKL